MPMPMLRKILPLIPIALLAWLTGAPLAHAQGQIFRCPGTPVEYINDAQQARTRGCSPMEGGNITIIQGTTPRAASTPAASRPA